MPDKPSVLQNEGRTIRQLPAVEKRVETGAIQFGDDWPGTFIRGDNAAWFAMLLKQKLDGELDRFYEPQLRRLLAALESSDLTRKDAPPHE